MKPISWSEYRSLPFLDVPYLVHRLIPEKCRILLVGPAKVGKSFFALQVALAVAQGRMFLGRQTKPGRVLYLQFDTPDTIWKERLDDLGDLGVDLSGDIWTLEPGVTSRRFNILEPTHQAQLSALMGKLEPALVIVDVLAKIHYVDANTELGMRKVWDHLNAIFADTALVVVHHTTKSAGKDGDGSSYVPRPSTAGRGSSFIGGEVDANWLLWSTGKDEALFWAESRFDEDLQMKAIRDPQTGLWMFPEEVEVNAETTRLLALCDEFPGQNHADLAPVVKQRFGISRSAYYRKMKGLPCIHTRQCAIPHTTPTGIGGIVGISTT